MVLEIIIIKFSCILITMSRNTFPEPQPDSASYTVRFRTQLGIYGQIYPFAFRSSLGLCPRELLQTKGIFDRIYLLSS